MNDTTTTRPAAPGFGGTFQTATLVGGDEIRVGDTYTPPRGPWVEHVTGVIVRITEGTVHDDAVWFVTVRTDEGVEAVRWAPRPGF